MKRLLHYCLLFTCTIVLTQCSPQRPAQIYKNPYVITTPKTQPRYEERTTPEQLAEDSTAVKEEKTFEEVTSALLPEIQTRKKAPGQKSKIALIIPQSGKNANLGKAMLDAAQLALFDIENPNLELVVLDNKSTEDGARAAANKALAENVSLILGPVFTETTFAVEDVIDDEIPIISFSNNRQLTNQGIFILGFMPEQQIRRVVEYAQLQGIEKFSALIPDNSFGSVALDSLKSALPGFKRPERVERYADINASISPIIERLTARDKPIEYPDWVNLPRDELKTEAILLPEGGRTAMSLAARIFRHGMDTGRFRLLGSGQWDDPEILKEKKLIGSWFATSPPDTDTLFKKHFKKNFGYDPIRIASLAYDGVALAAFLSINNPGGNFSTSDIANPQGFSGINGVFRLLRNGESERALAILEVTKRGFTVIDPAPTAF